MVGAGHSPLGRTVSDHTPSHAPGHQHHARLRTEMSYDPCAQLLGAGAGAAPLSNLSRRKLESEDSSYDSDHENLAAASGGLAAASVAQVSRSHEDVTRTYSETLGQVTHHDCNYRNTFQILLRELCLSTSEFSSFELRCNIQFKILSINR